MTPAPRKRGRPRQNGPLRPHRVVVTLSDAELAALEQASGPRTPAMMLRAMAAVPPHPAGLTFAAASLRLHNPRHMAPHAHDVADWLDRIAQVTK